MFRRKRFAAPTSDIPWWPAEDQAEPGGDHDNPRIGMGGNPPPLAAHDPFGGWPAFAEQGAVLDGPHPSSAWPLMERPGPPASPFAGPARPFPGGPPPGPAHPDHADLRHGEPTDIPEHLDPEADLHDEVPDWLPLLTHPVGGQRFLPDVEAGMLAPPGPPVTGPPATGRARSRYGRGPRRGPAGRPAGHGAGQDPAPGGSDQESLAGPATGVTTWLDPIVAPDPAEASALAGAFAADYLSWDQDNPDRRGLVLNQYLPSDVSGDASLLGWSGKGRQRAEISLPGAVQPDGEGRVMVDVRVRVTPFRRVGQTGRAAATAPDEGLEVAGVPAVAPAPTARGWKSLDSHWVRLTVPVTRDRGRLVVDTWDEQLDQDIPDPAEPDEDEAPVDGAPLAEAGTDDSPVDDGPAADAGADPTTAEDA